jgi:quercetin dioxygenase-like cupin family protein/DNA-binding Xre family transcriptional regulator
VIELPDLQSELGPALRAIRVANRRSLSEVAAATGISSSFLSLVENGKSDITVGRLTRLVAFYGVSVADLLPAGPSADPDIVRRAEQRLLPSPAEGISFYLLGPHVSGLMLPMIVEMEPSARLAEYGHHHGEEFVHVLEGTLALELEGAEPRILEDGDSAYYSAERPHLFRNADDGRLLRLICVDSPPNL